MPAIEIPDMPLWSQSIGGLIINFGIIEFQSLRWIQKLGGETAAVKARTDKLSYRIKAVMALLPSSPLNAAGQAKARDLWMEAGKLASTRNRVAHNPICVGRRQSTSEAVLSIIDVKKMTPMGQSALEPLDRVQIASVALHVRDIGRQLDQLIESIP
jgi:hypothetical protein